MAPFFARAARSGPKAEEKSPGKTKQRRFSLIPCRSRTGAVKRMKYDKVLVKLSGESLGENGKLFGHDMIDRTANILKRAAEMDIAVGVVIGAGNIWRGRQGKNMDEVTAHQMGMLGTVINCLCMRDALERQGVAVRMFSAIDMPRVCETYNPHQAAKAMKKGAVCLFAGGTGNPFFSTDTGVVLRAVETGADCILMAKNVDGVYTADPDEDPNAVLIRDISYEEAQARGLKVMDSAAFSLCAENKVPFVRVFGLSDPENILKVLAGDDMGTVLHPKA